MDTTAPSISPADESAPLAGSLKIDGVYRRMRRIWRMSPFVQCEYPSWVSLSRSSSGEIQPQPVVDTAAQITHNLIRATEPTGAIPHLKEP